MNQNYQYTYIPPQQGMYVPVYEKPKSHAFRNIVILLLIFFLFFTPLRSTLLVIGIDRVPKDSMQGRSDTMIVVTLPPVLPRMSFFSIPRDLWVNIPGYGENRINTAHYFAELYEPGTGKQAAAGVVESNFGFDVNYVVRLKFDAVVNIVDAMGGVTITLDEPMSGLEAGTHTLDGTQSLAFVRDRAGSDDFWRQKRGQMFISAAISNLLNPAKWGRLPAVATAALQAVDTNVPFWAWPRLAYGAVFSSVFGFETYTLDRNWVTPWVTDEGAMVLLPNWELIYPFINEVFN
ncbi:MAG: LCP family protein [Anaerolineaceae bacterium]|mgnify:CR=1 FL=1|nr:LCP family protein [Anaerolineaceae bacterium]